MAGAGGNPETKIWRAAEDVMRPRDRVAYRRETLAAVPEAMIGERMLALGTIWGELALRSFERGTEASEALTRGRSLAGVLQIQADVLNENFDDLLACQARSAAVWSRLTDSVRAMARQARQPGAWGLAVNTPLGRLSVTAMRPLVERS